MEKYSVQVKLDRTELNDLGNRYHFGDTGISHMIEIYDCLKSCVKADIFYDICHGDSESCLSWIPYDRYLCAAVTLGSRVDRLQDIYTEAGSLSDAYIIDCLGTELLGKLYKELEAVLEKEHGLYIRAYDFLGVKFPLSEMKSLLLHLGKNLPEDGITVFCNEAYMLIPKKSAVFVGALSEEKTDCSICGSCSRPDCPFRKKEKQNLNYGYQRIFGTKSQEE